MMNKFTDYFIKKYRFKSQKEIQKEEKSKREFNEYQQKIIDNLMREEGSDYDGENRFGPD